MDLFFVVLGLLSGIVLFYRFPTLSSPPKRGTQPAETSGDTGVTLSVIIPARNEAKNLPLLLESLLSQTLTPAEIICVDDGSTDQTKAVVESFEVRYLRVTDKPSDWTGKTFACQLGAQAVTGELLLFLDADVTLKPEALEQLVSAHQAEGKVISVQPYHRVTQCYEHGAMFFNAISVAGNGLACPLSKRKAGLFGPVILMSRTHFEQIGGYTQVKHSIIEDVELGRVFVRHGISYTLYAGRELISFRMYHSFRALVEGFAKNYALGATRAPLLLFLLTFFWMGGVTTAPLLLFEAVGSGPSTALYGALGAYGLFLFQLRAVLKQIGSFRLRYVVVFPLFLAIFFATFLYSIFCRIFLKKVTWKGREIPLNKS